MILLTRSNTAKNDSFIIICQPPWNTIFHETQNEMLARMFLSTQEKWMVIYTVKPQKQKQSPEK